MGLGTFGGETSIVFVFTFAFGVALRLFTRLATFSSLLLFAFAFVGGWLLGLVSGCFIVADLNFVLFGVQVLKFGRLLKGSRGHLFRA